MYMHIKIVYVMLPVSLCCLFFIVPSVFSPVSPSCLFLIAPSVFSVLSWLPLRFSLLFLCVVLIAPSVFSPVSLCCLDCPFGFLSCLYRPRVFSTLYHNRFTLWLSTFHYSWIRRLKRHVDLYTVPSQCLVAYLNYNCSVEVGPNYIW